MDESDVEAASLNSPARNDELFNSTQLIESDSSSFKQDEAHSSSKTEQISSSDNIIDSILDANNLDFYDYNEENVEYTYRNLDEEKRRKFYLDTIPVTEFNRFDFFVAGRTEEPIRKQEESEKETEGPTGSAVQATNTVSKIFNIIKNLNPQSTERDKFIYLEGTDGEKLSGKDAAKENRKAQTESSRQHESTIHAKDIVGSVFNWLFGYIV